jgi:hypothetical protein
MAGARHAVMRITSTARIAVAAPIGQRGGRRAARGGPRRRAGRRDAMIAS